MQAPRVAVIVRYGLDAQTWRTRHAQGNVVDETPYAYHVAEKWFDLQWSVDHGEGRVGRTLRRLISRIAGFDVVHVWKNRAIIRAADAVWTHTEREHLGVALLKSMRPRHYGAMTIAQSVWLWDQWPTLGRVRAAAFRRLLRRHDVEIVLSRANAHASRTTVPGRTVLRVPFGTHRARPRASEDPLPVPPRVLAIGNDRHRDWELLLESARELPELEFSVISLSKDVVSMAWPSNVRLRSMTQGNILDEAYREASVLAIPLAPNLHASGCTVAIEAISAGVQIVASDVGGIDEYVADSGALLVDVADRPGFVRALREAVTQPTPAGSDLARERGLTEVDYIRRLALVTFSLVHGVEIDPAVERFAPVPDPAEIEKSSPR